MSLPTEGEEEWGNDGERPFLCTENLLRSENPKIPGMNGAERVVEVIHSVEVETDGEVKCSGLPWELRRSRVCLQCRRPGFDPWVRKIPWRREWQPTPVFLPGETHGQRTLVGYSPWGCKELNTTEQLTLSPPRWNSSLVMTCLPCLFQLTPAMSYQIFLHVFS